ncbi:Roquin-1 [Frankliniella fusca]|uniref:Roquin-1 n=1 Tax=Frankliniella fusca TaxID=407009 RepID=A0AAE1HU68_9NEOP|nr:Roquin-1 [Frankliniella fusca]
MECNICSEMFNQTARIPKTVPCGHTVCLQCLQGCDRGECPTCHTAYDVTPESLPNNVTLVELMEQPDNFRELRGWCSRCRIAATRRCWDEHDVLSLKAAEKKLRKELPVGALQKAGALLRELHCEGEDAVHASTLLSAPSWEFTLRAGGRQLTGNLANTQDPLTKALWVVLASRAGLIETEADDLPVEDIPHSADPDLQPAEASSPLEMNVRHLSLSEPGARQEEKEAALQKAQGVLRLVGVDCYWDPTWSLELLQRAAPTVQRLVMLNARESHLRAVHAMPQLRRLFASSDGALDAEPPELDALPPGHGGLRWLSVSRLPRATLQSLLRAHGGTLEELVLLVGTPGPGEWPYSCSDLHSLLGWCGLRALRRLVLQRTFSYTHTGCEEQRAAVRAALPPGELQVLCGTCDGVQEEDA